MCLDPESDELSHWRPDSECCPATFSLLSSQLPKGMTEVITVPIFHPQRRHLPSSFLVGGEEVSGFLQEQRKQHSSGIKSLGPWAICVITQSFSFLICKMGSHYHHSFVVSMKGNNDCGTLFTWYAPKACHFMIFKFWILPPHHPPSKAGPRTT